MSRVHLLAAAVLLSTALLPLSASARTVAANPTGKRPYCAETFAIWLAPAERIDYAKTGTQAVYIFYTGGRKLALGDETSGRLPPGAEVGASHDLPTARVTELFRDDHPLGYLFENTARGVRTIILASNFSGYAKDKDLLARFNFGSERTCARVVAPPVMIR